MSILLAVVIHCAGVRRGILLVQNRLDFTYYALSLPEDHKDAVRMFSSGSVLFDTRTTKLAVYVAALHQGAPGQMTWLEDPPP